MISLAAGSFSRISSSTTSVSGAISWLAKCFLITIISALCVIIVIQIVQVFKGKSAKEQIVCPSTRNSLDVRDDIIPLMAFDIPMCYDHNYEPISRREVLLQGRLNRKRAYLTFGIPTVQRTYKDNEVSYLTETLNKLLAQIPAEYHNEVLFIILAADKEQKKRVSVVESVSKEFKHHIENGNMYIIAAPDRYYHTLKGLPQNFNDSAERVEWRGKQAMDYAFMFYYAHGLTHYYLQLEDDVVPIDNFYKTLKNDIAKREMQNDVWIIRKYYHMGFIGKLVKSEYLPYVAEYLRTFYFEAPCDWLHKWFLYTTGTEEETGPKLFHHIGFQSSSKGT